MIYFDHAATTELENEVYDFLIKSLKDDFANPSASHKLGKSLQEKIQNAKTDFLKMLGAKSSDSFYFTASATEANNTIIQGIDWKPGDAVVFSLADHKSVVEPILNLKNFEIELIHLEHQTNGILSIEKLISNKQVKLVVLTHVNNQSGNAIDLNATSKLMKELYPHAHLHVDMVQSFTKLDTKLNSSIDSASIAAHKIGGPKGVGGLYLKAGHKIKSLIIGGGQQGNFRSGTETYSLDIAFKLAAEKRLKNYLFDYKNVERLMSDLKSGIKKIISEVIFPFEQTSPYILCFIVPGISSDILLRHLEQKNIFLSSTSACSSKIKGFNSTLAALGIDEKFHKNVLRLSISKHTTDSEVTEFLSVLNSVWSDLKYLLK